MKYQIDQIRTPAEIRDANEASHEDAVIIWQASLDAHQAAKAIHVTGYMLLESEAEVEAVGVVRKIVEVFEAAESRSSRVEGMTTRDINRAIGATNALEKLRVYLDACLARSK
jgi:hypothetical protein